MSYRLTFRTKTAPDSYQEIKWTDKGTISYSKDWYPKVEQFR